MRAKYRPRYERYLTESNNRFAELNEIKAQAEPVQINDLENGKETTGGFPLLVENDRVWVDPVDHHNLIYGPQEAERQEDSFFS